MTVIMYSTGCPACNVLKKKLTAKGISFEEHTDEDEMISLGIDKIPTLSVDGNKMEFSKAIDWVNNKED